MLDLPVTHAVIALVGEVSLLLWGVRMVHSGVVRAFGGTLRHWLARALRRVANFTYTVLFAFRGEERPLDLYDDFGHERRSNPFVGGT